MAKAANYFKTPLLIDNVDGWGPGETAALIENHVYNLPYTPFIKGDKLGRYADPGRVSHLLDEQEGVFTPVEKAPPRKVPIRRPAPATRVNEVEAKKERDRQQREKQMIIHKKKAVPKSSVEIQSDWLLKDTISFSSFQKLSFNVGEPEEVAMCGALTYYDRGYDRVNPKSERRLTIYKDREFFKITASDDPVIRRLASEDKATVFATDTILSTLMCASRSIYSWDIVVQRVGNKLFFDKRDDSQLDYLTVNETSQDTPMAESKDDINSQYMLSLEATRINQNFSQQVLARDGRKIEFSEPNPFVGENSSKAASVGYRYRKWKLDDDTHLVVRCELHAVVDAKGGASFVPLNALNEFDHKSMDWRQKLETQRGAVLATEIKNNGNKVSKWIAMALLAGADMMKLGYVSRIHPRDPYNHVVLAVQGHKIKELAAQINLSPNNMWGIIKSIVDVCMKLPEGKYLFVKDPQKQQVRLYEVPADAFENDYAENPLPDDEQVLPAEQVVAEQAYEVDADV